MCGIVGIFSKSPINDTNRLITMRDAMTHRGPDSAGIWWSADKRIGLAHRRLAILDLSPSGNQPMVDSSGNYVITLNGEIYNFRELREELRSRGHGFHSSSDTEVLLTAYKEWGQACLQRLQGAFAFAIFDSARRELFLARDRAGEKPLYYHHAANGFVFASELKALLADRALPRDLDLAALDYYLAYGYVAGSQSIISNTCKLAAGHALVYDLPNDTINVRRYWELPENRPEPAASLDDLAGELEAILSSSIRRQLVADVSVGVLLSGGLDSALITAIAAKVSAQPLKTFTVSFPGHGNFNEAPYARMVADYFGSQHTELAAESAAVSLLPRLARQYDEPLADHSLVPTSMLAGLVRASVTVALGGDGGDELFGGYPHYNLLQRIGRFRRVVPASARKVIAALAAKGLPVGARGRNHLIGFAGDAASVVAAVNVYFDRHFRRRLLAPLYRSGYRPIISPEALKIANYDFSLSVFQNAARTDFQTTLVDDYLVKTDRASMLHGLELRAPFLDHRLVEFAFGRVPDGLRANLSERKILLRKLGKRLLPPALDIKRKQGFSLPLAAWFKGEWGAYMREILLAADPAIFDKNMICSLIKGQQRGLANANRLFALTMFTLWQKEYHISI